jgi:choline dehydrogenase-like flavoprotein
MTIETDTELRVDAVIVGSGCGGSVMAAELAQAGFSVLVIDKGLNNVRPGDLTLIEYDRSFEQQGLLPTSNP